MLVRLVQCNKRPRGHIAHQSTIYTEDREMLFIGNNPLDYDFIHPILPEFQVVSNIVQKSFVQYDSC
jgi:hypothetical protein